MQTDTEKNNNPSMIRHAVMMMIGTFMSRILGLAREVLVAAYFGATGSMDAFNVAYTLSNLARQLLAEGALSAAFVPVFSKILNDSKQKALTLARQTMTVLLFATFIVVGLGIYFAPALVKIMAPGFDAESRELAISMTRGMFPFLIFISIEALTMGELNSLGSFFIPAVSPAFSNLVFIITAPFFAARFGVYGLAYSVLCGGFAHFMSQWLWSFKMKAVLYPARPNMKDNNLRQILKLFLPYAAGLSLNQVNPVISRMLGSFLQEGSISVLNYSNRILQLPLGLFVIAISQAVLPQLARAKTDEEFTDMLRQAVRFALFVVLPASLGIMEISSEFVHLIFVRGNFNQWAWDATSSCLALSMLGLPGMACSTVIMRGLYALSMPHEAFKVTLFSVASTAVFSLILVYPMSYNGLALAPGIAFTLSGVLGLYYVRKKLNRPLKIITSKFFWNYLTALTILDVSIMLYKFLMPYNPDARLLIRSLWCLGVIALAAAAYSISTMKMKFEEWSLLKQAFSRKK
ncbi:MAG: murein biosynthesis integral membrane protein MurJ [Synergistales bacterium]|nr:murein biosynthesis integral membrane protein MurJ [Synergistales bacterium]